MYFLGSFYYLLLDSDLKINYLWIPKGFSSSRHMYSRLKQIEGTSSSNSDSRKLFSNIFKNYTFAKDLPIYVQFSGPLPILDPSLNPGLSLGL